jgi:putative two-component system response regulator
MILPIANNRILVVDDNLAIHYDFRSVLEGENSDRGQLDEDELFLFGNDSAASDGTLPRSHQTRFEIDTASQGQEAVLMLLEAVHAEKPYMLAFVDGRMPPGWNGLETIEHMWAVDPRLQVVFCTAYSDHSSEQIVDRLGESDRLIIIKKPFDPDEIRLAALMLNKKWHMERQAELRESELEQMVTARTRDIVETRDVAMYALARLAEERDNETGEHLERMRDYSQILAEYLAEHGPYAAQINEHFLTDFYRSTPLHDIGKVGISDAILLKPGRLTSDEFEIMKKHAVIGADMLQETAQHSACGTFLQMAADIARYHHERFDGSGYPDGLRGHDIPLTARIVAVADVFDAITSKRVYKDRIPADEAKEIIVQESGKHFDPVVVAAFTECYDEFLAVRWVERKDGVRDRQAAPQMAGVGA